MKRLFTVSMFFFVLALLFASGGKEGGGGSIKVWTYWDEIPAYQTWYDHIGAFKKANPGIELQVQFVSYNQMKDQLTVASMSGSLPDVMQMDYSWIISFANMGGLADVTDRFASSKSLDKKRYFKGPLDMCTVKGHMFAIPQDANNTALYYNKDMLAKAGLSNPPGTWAQLAEYAKKMSGGQIYGYCLSLNDPSIAVYEFMPYVWGGGGNFDDLGSQGTIAALKLFRGMVENGSMSPEVVNMDHDATAQQFMQSRAAMYQEGPWRLSGIEGNVSFAWDVAPLPAGPARQATSLGGEGLAIKAGKSEAAAWKFIEFTQAPDRALELAVGTRGLPVREDFLNASELFKTGKLSVFAKQMPFACARGPHPEMPKIEQAIMTMIHSVIIGTATPEAAAAAAAKDVAQYYK